MATNPNLSTSPGISQRTNLYAARKMLAHAMPVMVLERFALDAQMPKNKSATIKWRRPVTFTAADTPLQEGVTPSATSFVYEDVQANLEQYGQVVPITDVIEDTHEDPVLQDMTKICGENIGRTLEALDWGVLRGGTNVFYANGSARNAVNTPISKSKQRAVTRALKQQKARKFTSVLKGSPDYGTHPVDAAFIAVAHTDCESDIRNMPGFIPCAEYGSRNRVSEHEVGALEEVRYVLSSDLGSIPDAGGSTSTMVTTSGTSADIYPIIYMGMESWARVRLRGHDAVEPSIISAGTKTKDDPLGQRGSVGWKTYHAAAILNELWLARLEVAVTSL